MNQHRTPLYDHYMREVARMLEHLILATPTGPTRDHLCDAALRVTLADNGEPEVVETAHVDG